MPWRLRLLPKLGANALEPRNSAGVNLTDATSNASGFACSVAAGTCGGCPSTTGATAADSRKAISIARPCGAIRTDLISRTPEVTWPGFDVVAGHWLVRFGSQAVAQIYDFESPRRQAAQENLAP